MSAVVADVRVASTERLSPAFMRLRLAGDDLAELGRAGPWWDQRFKLVLPGTEPLPAVSDLTAGDPDGWYTRWLELPEASRGSMRTYTIRGVEGTGVDTRVVVDIVLHPGAHGPGSSWAGDAAPGSRAVLVGPRAGDEFGGVEFRPPPSGHMLLVADESAVPAVAGILADWPAGLTGTAYLEVPGPDDVLNGDLPAPPGVTVHWLPRSNQDAVGDRLLAAVRGDLGIDRAGAADGGGERPTENEDLPWETPEYSASGEPIDAATDHATTGVHPHVWVAGESGWVTALRRSLVRELGMDRSRVTFMGYWRRGVAMRG